MKINTNFSQKQSSYFDTLGTFQGVTGVVKESPALSIEFEAIVRNLGDNLRQKKILDVGCGSGRHSIRLARLAQEVVGIDISPKSIELAQKTAASLGIKNFIGQVGGYDQPIKSHYFDIALMVNVVHHIDTLDGVLKNIRQSLAPDGRLVIFEFNPLNPLFPPFLIAHGQFRAHWNKEYMRSRLPVLSEHIRKAGWEIVNRERYAWLPTLLYNYSDFFLRLNNFLNTVPGIRVLSAFHILVCRPLENISQTKEESISY